MHDVQFLTLTVTGLCITCMRIVKTKIYQHQSISFFVHVRIMRLAVTVFMNSNAGGCINYFVISGKR